MFCFLNRFISLPSKIPTKEQLLQTHSVEYINFLESSSSPPSASNQIDMTQINQFSSSDIYLTEFSYESALRSVGCTLSICDQILTG